MNQHQSPLLVVFAGTGGLGVNTGVVVVTILLLLVVIVLVHILMLCCFVVVVLGVAAAVLSVKAAEKWTCHKIYRRRGNAPNFRWHHLARPGLNRAHR